MTTSAPGYPGSAPIEAYGNGGFRFAGMSHRGSILCLPDSIIAWPVDDVDQLAPGDLAPVLAQKTDIHVLLLGSGRRLTFPPAAVGQALREAGIGLDVMDTGAACRTYNVLLAEKRQVAAALIAVA
jgi:uncharacterized protein